MKILTPITGWQEYTPSRGRKPKIIKPIKIRFVVAFDPYNWIIAKQGGSQNICGLKYFKGFCHLLPHISGENSWIHLAENVDKKLSQILRKPPMKKLDYSSDRKSGYDIDEYYKVNFNKISHDDVYVKLMTGIKRMEKCNV